MSDYTLKEELNLVELNLTTVKSLGKHLLFSTSNFVSSNSVR